MTLRTRLALALILAALLPMGVAVGVPMLQAERRAQEDADRRLDAARRQVVILVARRKEDAALRVRQAASEMEGNPSVRRSILQGPVSAAAAAARSMAERYGLDLLEIRNAEGALLSRWPGEADSGPRLPNLFENEIHLYPLSPPTDGASPRMAYFARRTVPLGNEPITLIGGRAVGRDFVVDVSEITGQPAVLVDGVGQVVETAGEVDARAPRIGYDIPLGAVESPGAGSPPGSWHVRISVPAGDAREVRRQLLVGFAGVAPLAVACALIVGTLLAAGISQPIRALASRAEAIAADQAAGPLSIMTDTNEVRRLGQSFDQMLQALSQSERQRGAAERIAAWKDVARRIAHEVKNPLSPIKVAVENLRRTREKAPDRFDRSFDEETSTILEEVDSLRRMVDEFSMFARWPKPQPVPCDLRQVVAQSVALFSARIEAAGVTLEISDGDLTEQVSADPEQIGRAIKNILANALDSLDALGPDADRRIEVSLRKITTMRAGVQLGFAEIAVRDSGVGLDQEAARRLFEPYFTTRAHRGGTGLGMAIVYRIVVEHGGRINATGKPGQGATITVRLPIKPSTPAPA